MISHGFGDVWRMDDSNQNGGHTFKTAIENPNNPKLKGVGYLQGQQTTKIKVGYVSYVTLTLRKKMNGRQRGFSWIR